MNKSVTKQKVKPCRLTTKETPIASCEVMVVDVIYRIAVQGIFVGIIIKAGVASLKVTDLLFAFPFCKNINQENFCPCSLAVCRLLISIIKFSERNVNNTTELQSLFVILFSILFIAQLSMQFQ